MSNSSTGAYIAAAIAALVGVALFVAYEKLQIESITLDLELVKEISKRSSEEIQELLDKQKEDKKE